MNYNDLHIGKNIEFLISISKHKKFEIAEMLGISRQQLRLIEKSEDVSTGMLKKIAFVLNIDIMDFDKCYTMYSWKQTGVVFLLLFIFVIYLILC